MSVNGVTKIREQPRIFQIMGEGRGRDVLNIDYVHDKIHTGQHYIYKSFESEGDGDEIGFLLTHTGSVGKSLHIHFDFACTQRTELYVYENTSYDTASGGTYIQPKNSCRGFGDTCFVNSSFNKDPVITNTGDLVEQLSVGATIGALRQGGSNRENEFVICSGETLYYLLRSKAGGNIISYWFDMYEQD